MSRKHMIATAEILRAEYALAEHGGSEREQVRVENIAGGMADLFARDSAEFDYCRFYEAALGRDSLRPTVTGRA